MAKQKLDPLDARKMLSSCRINIHANFFTLSSSQVGQLLEYADTYGYRKPKDANGSRGRYWHAYVLRQAQKAD